MEDTFKKVLSLLGHRNSLLWSAKQQKNQADAKRNDREELYRQITEHERVSTNAMNEVFHVNNALHKLFNQVPNMRCVEFMALLHNATDDDRDEAYTDFNPQEIMDGL
jgi:hypothetical protein